MASLAAGLEKALALDALAPASRQTSVPTIRKEMSCSGGESDGARRRVWLGRNLSIGRSLTFPMAASFPCNQPYAVARRCINVEPPAAGCFREARIV